MMGEQRRGGRGAGWRALGAMVPADHILRRIDGAMDLGELRDALAPHYSRRGRPSIAPELLIRMALIGRLYGITSERRLCEEVRFNLALSFAARRARAAPLDVQQELAWPLPRCRHLPHPVRADGAALRRRGTDRKSVV